MISESSPREVQSVRTAFRILTTIQGRDGATLQELAENLDLAKSTVHNYLGTLESMGYVVERDGSYRLGLRFLTHGMAAKSSIRIGDTVGYALSEVAADLSQPAWWIVEEFGRGIFVEKATADEAEETYGRLGKRSYLHTHAPGKAILATLPEEYVAEILDHHGQPALTTKTTTDREDLLAELERIRDRGYAVSEGGAALGVQSVGVAFDVGGDAHALGVFGYSHDFGRNTLEQDIPSVLESAVADIRASLDGG